MPDTSFEERARCYKCKEPGRLVKVESDRGSQHFTHTCDNERCQWYKTNWTFQVMPDGSIYEPKPRLKSFPVLPDRTEKVQQQIDEELKRSMGYY